MCDPVTGAMIASAALSAGGNAIQSSNNNASAKAQMNAKNAARNAGIIQQQGNQAEATGALNQTVNKFSQPNQQADLGSMITNRTNALASNVASTPATGLSSQVGTAPKVVQDSLGKALGDAAAYSAQQGGAQARIGATGDQFLNNGLNLNDSQLKLGTISNFAGAQQKVNEQQQQQAWNNARKGPSTLGSALSDVGTVLGLASAGGGAGLAAGNNAVAGATGTNLFNPQALNPNLVGPQLPSYF